MKYKDCRAKIFYPGIEAGKEYCLCRIEASKKDCLRKGLRSSKDFLSRETNKIFPTLRSC